MLYAYGMNYHINGSIDMPKIILDDSNTKPNLDYIVWLHKNQLVLRWIVALFQKVSYLSWSEPPLLMKLGTNFLLHMNQGQGHIFVNSQLSCIL